MLKDIQFRTRLSMKMPCLVQRSPVERQAFPQEPTKVSSSILCNQQNMKAGRSLLEDIAFGSAIELQGGKHVKVSTDTKAKSNASRGQMPVGIAGQGSNSHSVPKAPETSSGQLFDQTCATFAQCLSLCSDGIFMELRDRIHGLGPSHRTHKPERSARVAWDLLLGAAFLAAFHIVQPSYHQLCHKKGPFKCRKRRHLSTASCCRKQSCFVMGP
jgi:hypothetical protein